MRNRNRNQISIGEYSPELKQLDILERGASGIVAYINGGRRVVKRLLDLGITLGTKITLQEKGIFTGPVVISVRGSNLTLGRGIAVKIFLEIEKEENLV